MWEVRRRHQLSDRPKTASLSAQTGIPGQAASSQGATPRRMRQPRARRHWGRRFGLLLFLLVLAAGGVFGYKIISASNKISVADSSVIGQLKDLLFGSGEVLQGEGEDRVNILLLAVGGEGHKGENLADTIMVASIRPQTNEVALLSIPRDLYVQVPGEDYYTKINAVHSYGESKKKDGGPEALSQTVKEITGQPIHYFARIDFTAFKTIVDAVGGVNITIENSFHDYWHKIDFQEGTEKMNGERALAYVRARYVEGPEGGDFKRAARQQQVLLALREKVFSVNTAFDFGAVNTILNSLSNNIRTDMQLWEMKRFFEMTRLIDQNNVHSVVLSTGHNGVLVGSTEVLGGVPASVLRPRTGDYSEIQNLTANIFSAEVNTTVTPQQAPSSETQATPEPTEEPEEEAPKPKLEIRNGTNVAGLAKKTSDELQGKGYEVLSIGNAANRTTEQTTVYSLKATQVDGAQEIAELLGASASSNLPEGEAESDADVLIILGSDAQN